MKTTIVNALSPALQFVSDSQDTEAIREHIGDCAAGYDSFFVAISDGDYAEVWGMCGIVPYLSKLVTRIL
jgi:hypothetical protein